MTDAAEVPQRRLSVVHLTLLIPWVVAVIGAWQEIEDNSFLWHVRAGTLQGDHGAVLTEDPFSFTMLGESWRTQSWLAELGYGWAEGLFGLDFVPYLLLMTTLLVFTGVGLIAFRKSSSVTSTALVIVLGVFVLVSFLAPRPVILSYLLMTLVILAWDRVGMRWALPFLFWIWASVHASFVIGLAFVALSLIMDRRWRQIPTLVLSGLVTLATAHGVGVVGYLLHFQKNSDALQYLTEWRSPSLEDPIFLAFLASVAMIVVGAFRGRIRSRHLWIVVPFLILGMSSVRAMPIAWLSLVPLMAASVEGLEWRPGSSQSWVVTGITAGVIIVLPFFLTSRGGLSTTRFPIEAANQLDSVRTFHDDVVGGYLIWDQGPQRLVYVDDRAELYGDRLGELVALRQGEVDWTTVFERDGIEQVLLRRDEPLVQDLEEGGWVVSYEDENFTILKPTKA